MSEDARRLLSALVPGRVDQRTPERWVKALGELLCGYEEDPRIRTFPANGYDEIVAVAGISFASLCEHHVLPFTGTVDVGYLPSRRIIGLSKIPRLVRVYSRRLQVQERLTREIADALAKAVRPRGVAVVVRGVHTCMTLRGIEGDGRMVTSVMTGVFRKRAEARAEFFELVRPR